MPKRSMPRLNVTRCGDTASLAVASVARFGRVGLGVHDPSWVCAIVPAGAKPCAPYGLVRDQGVAGSDPVSLADHPGGIATQIAASHAGTASEGASAGAATASEGAAASEAAAAAPEGATMKAAAGAEAAVGMRPGMEPARAPAP